jgi:hypothetical protein
MVKKREYWLKINNTRFFFGFNMAIIYIRNRVFLIIFLKEKIWKTEVLIIKIYLWKMKLGKNNWRISTDTILNLENIWEFLFWLDVGSKEKIDFFFQYEQIDRWRFFSMWYYLFFWKNIDFTIIKFSLWSVTYICIFIIW